MKEITGDIWDYHEQGHWIVITTNGTLKKDGSCVMGRGVAAQAKERIPSLPHLLGASLRYRDSINQERNTPFFILVWRLATFPVKHNWWEKADLQLIGNSAKRLSRIHVLMELDNDELVFLVRPGCGNGGLSWKDVKPILERYLDDRFIIVEREP